VSADDRFEDEHGAALMQARYEIATERVAEGKMLAAAGRRESTDFNAWQQLAAQFRKELDAAPGPVAVRVLADKYADALAAAFIELAARR